MPFLTSSSNFAYEWSEQAGEEALEGASVLERGLLRLVLLLELLVQPIDLFSQDRAVVALGGDTGGLFCHHDTSVTGAP